MIHPNLIQFLNRHLLSLSAIFLFIVFFCRFAIGGYDPGYFILASKENVIKENLVHDIPIIDGGYDGMYFYRYALHPFSKDLKSKQVYSRYGIKIDHVKYRRARILYPLVAWILALGQTSLVPYSLILVNILAFIFLLLISKKVVAHFRAPPFYALFPLLIGGLYLSVARDLSDTLGCALLAWCYLCFLHHRITWFLIASSLLLLCRETSAFYLLPAYALLFFKQIGNDSFIQQVKIKLPLFLPWLILLGWKIFLHSLYPDNSSSFLQDLSHHFGLPFEGMYEGLQSEIFFFKINYIAWTLLFFAICLKVAFKNWKSNLNSWAFWVLPISILLTLSYGKPIYEDHWSFVRVLAPTHLFCFYFLLENKRSIPKIFFAYSLYLTYYTIRSIILHL